MLTAGDTAPDFSLENQRRDVVRLSDFRGRRHVVVVFHPLAFTPVCATQMQTYERERPRLDALGAHVLAISVDAGPAKNAWAESLGGISYDLLSDFHPKGAVASAYGVMRGDGISDRAIFIVDTGGRVAWSKKYEIPEQPPFDEIVEQLERLRG